MRASTYGIVRIEGRLPSPPDLTYERRGVFQLDDVRWRFVFRDTRCALSSGLLTSRLHVESLNKRECRLTIRDVSDKAFEVACVLDASEGRLRSDLEQRLASVEHAIEVVAAINDGEWWWDSRFFSGLDWSQALSIAGVHYRSGWWGTGKMRPTMLPKVLDFDSRGILLRGWRKYFEIPWDTVASIGVAEGDPWHPERTAHRAALGTTILFRPHSGQDAVFFTPLLPHTAVRDLVQPLIAQLEAGRPFDERSMGASG